MADKILGEWISLALSLVVVGLGVAFLELGPEPAPPSPKERDQVEILNWNWKKSVNGRILAVFGSVKNKAGVDFEDVILELRVEDDSQTVLTRHTIPVGGLAADQEKPFRKDVLRSGKEKMGYLEVLTLKK